MNIPSERCLGCQHYLGSKIFNEIDTETEFQEGDFLPYCKAFPEGIPEEISIGENLHTEPLPEQGNDLVYVKNEK